MKMNNFPRSRVLVFRLVKVLLLFSIGSTTGKEYKFCSKADNTLYSFTSEACSGGVFFKEPLIIDPKCYCHDSE
jgi:hypothetical protein